MCLVVEIKFYFYGPSLYILLNANQLMSILTSTATSHLMYFALRTMITAFVTYILEFDLKILLSTPFETIKKYIVKLNNKEYYERESGIKEPVPFLTSMS